MPTTSAIELKKALFRGRDWITTQEWTDAEIEVLLDVSADLKRKFRGRIPHRYLPDETLFLMFFDKSTRTRNSFEAGITQLGGHAIFPSGLIVTSGSSEDSIRLRAYCEACFCTVTSRAAAKTP